MGSYASWQAAIGVFFHPENQLLPSIRPAAELTSAFTSLVGELTSATADPLTEQSARANALSYWNSVPDRPAVPMTDAAGNQLFPCTEQLSEAQLTTLQGTIENQQYGRLYAGIADIPPPVREVFFDLPVQLASALSQAASSRRPSTGCAPCTTTRGRRLPADLLRLRAGDGEPGADHPRPRLARRRPARPARVRCHPVYPYLWFTVLTIAGCLCDWADSEFTQDTAESRSLAGTLYRHALDVLSGAAADAGSPDTAGLPPNTRLATLTARASGGLTKLRAGLNIAGLARPLSEHRLPRRRGHPAADQLPVRHPAGPGRADPQRQHPGRGGLPEQPGKS